MPPSMLPIIATLVLTLVSGWLSNQARAQAVTPASTPASAPASSTAGGAASIPADATKAFAQAAAYSEQFSGRAVLIMVNGAIVHEAYASGWNAGRAHPLASGTKSFTGVTAIAAIQDGLISSLDEVVSDTITEWKNDPRKSKITVRHLLTLSSGLDPAEATLGSRGAPGGGVLGKGRNTKMDQIRGSESVDDKFAHVITVPSKHAPGERFEYGSSHFYAFGEFLQRKLEKSDRPEKTTLSYMNARIFEPCGLPSGRLNIGQDRAGNPNLPGGFRFTAREWAAFGEFVRLGGAIRKPDGTLDQHLDPALFRECFTPSATNPNYGLTWWLLRDPSAGQEGDEGGRRSLAPRERLRNEANQTGPLVGPDGKPVDVYMAAGLGKQRLLIVPAYGLVVVRFAENTPQGAGFANDAFLTPILQGVRAMSPAAADGEPPAKPRGSR